MSIDTSVGRVEYVSRVSECRLTPVSKCLAKAQVLTRLRPKTRQATRLKCARSALADGTCARSALHI